MIFGNDPSTAMTDIVKLNGKHYYVDSRLTFDHGYETMVFPCDANGNVMSWCDLYAEWYTNIEDMRTRHTEIVNNLGDYLSEEE